ncbi:MAG TPA: serine/threonine-protein kinase, partial [Acidimicrobiales bacterium]
MAGTAPHIPGCRDLSLIGERVARSLFSATSDRVGRPVTVTVYPPLSEGRTRDGFDRAAAIAQRLGAHPSVITIHDWGHAADGRPWIVTEPQPAESVDTLLVMDGSLDVERAVQVGVLLAGALETTHRAGIVHGDLSPARLVFGDNGEPLLAETGLAEFAVFPGLGALNNPVRYFAPPEVLERTQVGPATDVFSLATTVYALLAGRAPQQKPAEITDSNASLLLRILQMPVPRIERPDLPPGLEDVLRSAMSPSPDKRPQTAIEVAWLLQDVQRRAGYGVTEPVVLDLDDLAAGDQPARSRTDLAPAVGAAPPPPEAPPLDPLPDLPPEVEPNPPTIFPFDDGAGAAPGGAGLF